MRTRAAKRPGGGGGETRRLAPPMAAAAVREGGMERRKEEGGGGGGGGGEGGRRSVCVRVRVWIAKSDLFSWLLLLEWREGGGGCGGGGVGTMAAIFVHFGCGMLVAECLWATNVSHSELQGCQAVVGILGGPNTMRIEVLRANGSLH